MKIGFYMVFRRDPQHFVHATALVESCRKHMPSALIWQFTDETTAPVPGVDHIRRLPHGPMLQRRLEHYAQCEGDWLFLDTDVEVRADVQDVFPATPFDVALADRNWPGTVNGEEVLLTMPFNTGVVFTRNQYFWQLVLNAWLAYPEAQRDWMSEQRAVWAVVRRGEFLVKILEGQIYNYPPKTADDPCPGAKLVHYKGPRKAWWTDRFYQSLRVQATELVAV